MIRRKSVERLASIGRALVSASYPHHDRLNTHFTGVWGGAVPSRPVLVLSGWVCVEEGGDECVRSPHLSGGDEATSYSSSDTAVSIHTLHRKIRSRRVWNFWKMSLNQAQKLSWLCSGVLGSAWFSRSSPCWQMMVKGRCYVIAYCLDQRQL